MQDLNNAVSAAEAESMQVARDASRIDHVLGEPGVSLDTVEVKNYLRRQLRTPLLDELHNQLWIIAKQSFENIDALHVQQSRGRRIVPFNDARLHLVWSHDRIFVKPLPACLLNHDFWKLYIHRQRDEGDAPTSKIIGHDSIRALAQGFLRSYALLIETPLHLKLAQGSHLVPDDVDWYMWSKFIHGFRHLQDDAVAKRYHFGQLRLTRLNWLVRLHRPHSAATWWFYDVPHWSIGAYLRTVAVPLLFIFASVTLTLSSMQVALTVPPDVLWSDPSDAFNLRPMYWAFWAFSLTLIWASVVIWSLLLGVPLIILAWQLQWGFRHRSRNKASVADSRI